MNRKALIVVDMQEVCIGENHAECFQHLDSLLSERPNGKDRISIRFYWN